MTYAQGRLRATPGAAGISGISMQAYHDRPGDALHNVAIAGWTATTGADGQWSFQADGCVGPHYWANATPYDGKTRRQSSRAGGLMGAVQVLELPYLLGTIGSGVSANVLNALPPAAGAGLTVTVGTGAALVKEIGYVNYVLDTLTFVAPGANARIDTIVIEVSRLGQLDEGRSELKVVAGTPAAAPVAPALTQTAAVWQLPIADVRTTFGSGVITSVTDRRVFLLQPATQAHNPTVDAIARRTDGTPVAIGITQQVVPELTANPVLLNGVIYEVMVEANLVCFVRDAARVVDIAPYIGSTSERADYRGHNIADYVSITNAHKAEGVVGTGAALSCGLLAHHSGGSGTNAFYKTGTLSVRAIPRS